MYALRQHVAIFAVWYNIPISFVQKETFDVMFHQKFLRLKSSLLDNDLQKEGLEA